MSATVKHRSDDAIRAKELLHAAERFNPKRIILKLSVAVVVALLAAAAVITTLALILEGVIVDQLARRLAAVVLITASGILLVAVLSGLALMLSVLAYLRLSVLVERTEKEELIEEEMALVSVIRAAIKRLPVEHQIAFMAMLQESEPLQQRPAVLDELIHSRD